MPRWLFFTSCLLACLQPAAQPQYNAYTQRTALLTRQATAARNDSERVMALGRLAGHYYVYKANAKADSVLQEQLYLAEHSENSNLMLSVLFSYSINSIDSWNSISSFERAMHFVEKGAEVAKKAGRNDYLALALIRKAALLRNRGRYDAALEQAVQAGMAVEKIRNDSIRAVLLLETGDIFLAKGNAVAAYQNYNNAWDLAYARKNLSLQTEAYHHIGLLYHQLGRSDLGADVLKTSLDQNLAARNGAGALYDFVDLARVTDKKEYIEKAIFYADSLQSERQRLFAKQLMLAYYMVVEKDSRQALHYLNTNTDLQQLQLNRGAAQYLWQIGSVYYYANRPDSAIRYFLQAAPALLPSLDPPSKIELNKNIGSCLVQLGRMAAALPYLTEAAALAKASNTLITHHPLLLELSRTQAATGNFGAAYETGVQYNLYRDSANRINSGRELALLEVERANSKHQYDLAALAEREHQRKSLEYMAISLAILLLFILLVVAGLFPNAAVRLLRPLGFIAFICLFEFLILLIDTSLHHATHGAPLLIWLAKIGIIAILLPLHHFLEHKVVHYLQSKRMSGFKERLRSNGWWSLAQKKKPATAKTTAQV